MTPFHRFSLVFALLLAGCITDSQDQSPNIQMSRTLADQGKTLLAAGKTEQAKDVYLSAITRDDHNARAWNGLGVAYDLQGKSDKAKDAYQHAVDLDPTDLIAANNLAHVYLVTGDAEAAVKLLQPHADDTAAPAVLRQNLQAATAMVGAQNAVDDNVYADLGSYGTEGTARAHALEAKNLLGDNGKDLTFLVIPEVKITGGTPVFTVKVAGQAPQPICDTLYAKGIPCVPYGK